MTVSELTDILSSIEDGKTPVVVASDDDTYGDKYVITGVYKKLPDGDVVIVASAIRDRK